MVCENLKNPFYVKFAYLLKIPIKIEEKQRFIQDRNISV